MKRVILLIFLFTISFLIYATAKTKKKPMKLKGVYTLLACYEEGKMKDCRIDATEIVFSDKNRSISIYLGCNRIIGDFQQLKNNRVRTAILSSTRMACPGNLEDVFKNNFTAVTSFKTIGDRVELYNGKILAMVLQKKNKSKEQTYNSGQPDGTYKLQKISHDTHLPDHNFQHTKISIQKNRINGNVGCNSISGSFNVDGDNIQPMKLMMTEMYCEKTDALEKLFTNQLEKVNSFKIRKNLLELYKDDEMLMILERVQD